MNVVQRFEGGKRLLTGSLSLGLAGLIATAIGFVFDARQALFSYLVGVAYWLGIAVGSLILLASFHASNAKWPVVIRRMLEKMSVACIVFVPLFIPIVLGMKYLFIWASRPANLDAETRALLDHKQLYLNIPFFLIRAAIYFAIWVMVAYLLSAWSTRQDTTREARLTLKQRRLGAASLPFLGLSVTFAAFDWLMSLEPTWYSTIFGVYYFAGGFVAAIALLTLITVLARGPNLYGSLVSADHYHNLGNFLFAFVIFWAYIAFSQFMLIWIADLPEEVPWYLARVTGKWRPIAVALAFGHFVLPFFALLFAELKRSRRALGVVAAWVLIFHYLDVYWLIMPALHPDSAGPIWTHATAFVGVGGVAVAFTVWILRGGYTVPVGDPYLRPSLSFRRP
jgi:hypothetical protein